MKIYLEEALALAYGIVASPVKTIGEIMAGRRLYEGLIMWALSVSLSVLSVCVQWDKVSVWAVAAIYVGGAFFLAVRVFAFHCAARLLGGQGTMKTLLSVLCFSELPLNIATLVGSMVFVLPEMAAQLISLAAAVWAFILDVYAVRGVYGLSTARSVAALLLPALFFVGLLVFLVVYLAISIMSFIG